MQTVETLIRRSRIAASDLGLHCLPMSHKKDARLICVNTLPAYDNFCCLLITFATKVDIDQAQHFVVPDLDPNCITYYFGEKKSADKEIDKHAELPSMQLKPL